MVRIARIVAPGMQNHIIQRGNRRLQTFFSDKDWAQFLSESITAKMRSRLQKHESDQTNIDLFA